MVHFVFSSACACACVHNVHGAGLWLRFWWWCVVFERLCACAHQRMCVVKHAAPAPCTAVCTTGWLRALRAACCVTAVVVCCSLAVDRNATATRGARTSARARMRWNTQRKKRPHGRRTTHCVLRLRTLRLRRRSARGLFALQIHAKDWGTTAPASAGTIVLTAAETQRTAPTRQNSNGCCT